MAFDWTIGESLTKPCGHARPQDASQLHGVCIFCWRDRAGALEQARRPPPAQAADDAPRSDRIRAAMSVDWGQARAHGGSPCFHLEAEGRFCLRADRWAGHQGEDAQHLYEPLYVAMTRVAKAVHAERPPAASGGWMPSVEECVEAFETKTAKLTKTVWANDVRNGIAAIRSMISARYAEHAAREEKAGVGERGTAASLDARAPACSEVPTPAALDLSALIELERMMSAWPSDEVLDALDVPPHRKWWPIAIDGQPVMTGPEIRRGRAQLATLAAELQEARARPFSAEEQRNAHENLEAWSALLNMLIAEGVELGDEEGGPMAVARNIVAGVRKIRPVVPAEGGGDAG